jgi:tRNA-dihydrouridine synthase 2
LALDAAMHVYKDVDAIDINMGCPKKFSVSGGMGSALLQDPDRASNIIKTLRNALPNTPVSAKIRLLKDTSATIDFCQALINAGANAIAIHGRRVGDEATQPAHWDELKETVKILRSKYTSLPILINGDFYTRAEWTDFCEETGANGVLLARPALYNTSIFRKPTDPTLPTSTYGYDSPLLEDKSSVVQEYLKRAVRYNMHHKNAKYVVCEMMQNRRTPIPRVRFMPQDFPGGQTIGMTCNCHSLEEMCILWNVKNEERVEQTAAPAGEHRYEDSYFLKDDKAKATDDDTIVRDAKRPRVEVSLQHEAS